MSSARASKIWLALGASLAISGGFAIAISLPEGGEALWLGVGLVATGSIALRRGVAGPDRKSPPSTRGGLEAGAKTGDSLIEPELRSPGPRTATLAAKGKLVLCVWMAVLAIFGLLTHRHFGHLPAPAAKKLLDQEGITASARLHVRESRSAANGDSMYFLSYSFIPDSGSPIRVSQSVPSRVYARVSEGETTKFVYMRLNPEQHYLPEITSAVTTGMVVFIAAMLLLAAGVAEAQRRLHRRLVISGRAVCGFTANVRRRGGVRSFLVNYDADGKRYTHKATERNPGLRDGQPITVLHDPAIPNRAILYRQALYKIRA